MIKGCKHYFTMFGIMMMAINRLLVKLFSRIDEQDKKVIPIHIRLVHAQLQTTLQKNQKTRGN